MGPAAILAVAYSTKETATATNKFLSGDIQGFVIGTLKAIPVIGNVIGIVLDAIMDSIHNAIESVLKYIPQYIDPDLVPAVLARVSEKRSYLIGRITMDLVAKLSWEISLIPDYEPSSRGSRIANDLEDICLAAGAPKYEVLLLKARIYKRFNNGPKEVEFTNAANAIKSSYNGFLVNPNWGSKFGGGKINLGETLQQPSNLLLIGGAAVLLFLALRKSK